MNIHRVILPVVASLAVALIGCNTTEEPKETVTTKTTITVKDTVEVNVTARVKSINHANRVMTLQDKTGNAVTFVVDDKVQRLNEVMVGDEVNARFKATLLAELRPATPEETANPIKVVDTESRAPQTSTPEGGMSQSVRVVTTVEAVDVDNMFVTLRGPMGDSVIVRGRNPENVKKLRVGDTIVITYTNSVAIALEKIAPR